MTVQGAQLEAKDHPTPYTPSTRSASISNEALPIPTIAATSFNLVKDAGVGTYSYNFNANHYIATSLSGDITQGVTVSFWLKDTPTSGSYVVFADINSKLSFGFFNNQGILSCGGLGKPTANFSTLWKNGEWNHIVVRKDSAGNHTCFINGEETPYYSSTNEWTHTAYTTIGARYNNGVYERLLVGKLSDFRIYMTALSNDDILRLYKTKAYVSDYSDFCAGQFVTGNYTKAMVTDKGVVLNKNVTEEINATYEILDGILLEKNPYFDTGVAFTDANIPIYIAAEITPTNISGNNCLAGCGESSWNGPVMLNLCAGKFEYGTGGYSTTSAAEGAFAINERIITKAEIYTSTQKWYKNNALIPNITSRTRTGSSTTLYVGTFHTPSGTVGETNSYQGYIHNFSINYGSINKYFIPVKRKSDNILGFYEVNGKTFHTNQGNGSFIAGDYINAGKALIFTNGSVSGKTINEV